ncbi:MAG: type II toxin-antitoxin system VapC family toxin [Candidatus Geothermarchaeales archaeon]
MSTREAFVDTTVFVAAAFPKERHHKEGAEIVASIEEGRLGKPTVTDYIVDEVATFTRRKKGARASIEVLEALLYSPRLRLVKVTERHFEAGIQLFKTYERLSFTDAASVAVMRDLGIETIYSFDSGFDGVPGVVRLAKPER